MHFSRYITCVLFLLGISLAYTGYAKTASKFVVIGTAGVTGVYYPAGGAICRLVNLGSKDHGIRCTVESTGGSVENINAIRRSELDMGVVQSDWQYHAYKGSHVFREREPYEGLRSVFSMHSEPFTVLARRDSGIRTFDDLKGKRVNIGNPGSGMRATMNELMKLKGWSPSVFRMASELKATEQGEALCKNRIDALIYTAGHPNKAIQKVTSECDAVLVPVEGTEVDALVQQYPFYAYALIPGGMYAGNTEPVKTFGVKATFVSSSQVDANLIYIVVKAIFENFDDFKTLHPVFSTLRKEDMVMEGNTAPLHEGAKRYFEEVGLLKIAQEKAEAMANNALKPAGGKVKAKLEKTH